MIDLQRLQANRPFTAQLFQISEELVPRQLIAEHHQLHRIEFPLVTEGAIGCGENQLVNGCAKRILGGMDVFARDTCGSGRVLDPGKKLLNRCAERWEVFGNLAALNHE